MISKPFTDAPDLLTDDPDKFIDRFIDEFQHQNWFFSNLPMREVDANCMGDGMITYRHPRWSNSAPAFARDPETYSPPRYVTTNIATLVSSICRDVHLKEMWIAAAQWELMCAAQGISDLFNEMVIHGDICAHADHTDHTDPIRSPAVFDGLDKIIRTESTHVWETPLDLTGLGLADTMAAGTGILNNNVWMNTVMPRINHLDPKPTFILGNDDLISALSELGRRTGMYAQKIDKFGRIIGSIEGIDLIPMGRRNGAYKQQIIPTEKVNLPKDVQPPRDSPDGYVYKTQAYVGSFGPTAIEGFTLPGDGAAEVRPPESMDKGSWVKKWRVALTIGMAVMSPEDACGMFTNIYLPKELIEPQQYVDEIQIYEWYTATVVKTKENTRPLITVNIKEYKGASEVRTGTNIDRTGYGYRCVASEVNTKVPNEQSLKTNDIVTLTCPNFTSCDVKIGAECVFSIVKDTTTCNHIDFVQTMKRT